MRFTAAQRLVTPLAMALNAIPIFVLVSVFNNMFAITRDAAAADGDARRVLHRARQRRQGPAPGRARRTSSCCARTPPRRREVLPKARVPNAVPYLFTALKIAAPAAVITAFVAEYFGGRQNGLGTGSRPTSPTSRTPAWAYVFGACLLGLTFYLISIGLESITTHHGAASPGGAT